MAHRRQVSLDGSVDITDHETFGANERCNHRLAGDRSSVLTSGAPSDSATFAWGCGGEVRVELLLNYALRDNGDVTVSGRVHLFEGTSETTTDLDGDEAIAAFVVAKDASVAQEITVRNEREGGDYAVLSLTFSNIAA